MDIELEQFHALCRGYIPKFMFAKFGERAEEVFYDWVYDFVDSFEECLEWNEKEDKGLFELVEVTEERLVFECTQRLQKFYTETL